MRRITSKLMRPIITLQCTCIYLIKRVIWQLRAHYSILDKVLCGRFSVIWYFVSGCFFFRVCWTVAKGFIEALSVYIYVTQDSNQRVNTSRGEKGGGQCFFQIEPNWPLPYSTVPVPRLRDARPAGWVTSFSICVSTKLRAQNRTAKGSILK